MSRPPTLPSTRSIIAAGTQLNGVYEIDEPIAAGGMGEIYKGHAIQTGDLVAIKLIRSDLGEAQAAFALFRKEAAALHNLYHEAIVRYYVFSVDPVLERPYLAMEFVDGQALSAMVRGGPLAFEAVHRLMQRIAAGLDAAHERGIIHRDVSPDNIIIPAGDMGRAKIIDFGIARSTRLDGEGTIIGSGFAGKYNYVSPEQLGLFGGEVTPKSDIYSLGLVLCEALRGSAIDMGGNTLEVVEKRRKIPDLTGIDDRLRPMIERMLQPDPADRPASMAEIAAFTAEPPRRAVKRKIPPVGRTQSFITRVPISAGAWLVAASIVAAAGAAAGAWFLTRGPAPQKTEPARPLPALEPAAVKAGLGPMKWAELGLAQLPHSASALEPVSTDGRGAAAARFIDRYDGGDCFFARLVPSSGASVAIEGFGQSTAPFHDLDKAFLHEIGSEADIGVHRVAEGQCPALAFLQQLRATPASGVTLDLAAGSLATGQVLAGTVFGLGGRAVNVLLVDAGGSVHVLPTAPAGARDDRLSFSLPTTADLGVGKLQLVVAVASPEGLTAFRGTARASAGRLFPRALEEAKRAAVPLAAAAGSFKVVN
jgi:serine/threonine-protein kinase